MKARITTVDDDQGWLDAAGINYKVNDVVEIDRAEFDQLNAYAANINNEVCGPAISVEDVTASQENDAEAIELMQRFSVKKEAETGQVKNIGSLTDFEDWIDKSIIPRSW